MKERIRTRAFALGFDNCRFATAGPPESARHLEHWLRTGQHGEMTYLDRNAHKRIDPQQVLPGARSVVCVAMNYGSATDVRSTNSDVRFPRWTGAVARYAHYSDYHAVMGDRLRQLSGFIAQESGGEARSLWYVDTGPVLEREFAQRAGLGFVGKHTNVISRRYGNWILLGEILTTAELDADSAESNRCGKCTRCIDACPTRAIRGPFQLDARRCISYLTIELKGSIPEPFRPAIGTRIFGCDDCLAVCPWNRFAQQSRALRAHHREDLVAPGLLDLLQLDEPGFKQRFRGTPIERSKRRGLLRNVCVALGNAGDRAALPALEKACRDREPLIAEHARWAIGRITEPPPSAGPGQPGSGGEER